MEQTEQNIILPKAYLLSVNSISITLIIIFIFSGYNHWPFISTVMLGAAAQTIFRIIKRAIKYKIQKINIASNNEETSNLSSIKIYSLIYITMVFVTALWFGVGVAIGKIF